MENAQTKSIEIVVNGQSRLIPENSNVTALLHSLEIEPSRVAVELNRQIVRKPDWESTRLDEGARVEIVWFVGGGSI